MKRAAIVFVLAVVLAPAAGAQRASRPADDWIATLEAPERVASLKIPEVVAAMKVRPGDIVADLGAGSGLFVVPLSSATGANGKVLAVEIDRNFFPAHTEGDSGGRHERHRLPARHGPEAPEPVEVRCFMMACTTRTGELYQASRNTEQRHHRNRRLPGKQGPLADPSLQVGRKKPATLMAENRSSTDDVAPFSDNTSGIYRGKADGRPGSRLCSAPRLPGG